RCAIERVQACQVAAGPIEPSDIWLHTAIDSRAARAEVLGSTRLPVGSTDGEGGRRARWLRDATRGRSCGIHARQIGVRDVAPVRQVVRDRRNAGADLDKDVPLLVEATWIRIRGQRNAKDGGLARCLRGGQRIAIVQRLEIGAICVEALKAERLQ